MTLAACMLCGPPASGQLADEIVLLINANNERSMTVGTTYAAWRSISPSRVVFLDVPAGLRRVAGAISPAEFREIIWEPVLRHLRDRGLGDTTLAWVYSTDFPTAVTTNPEVSLTGMTFVGGRPPPAGAIQGGHFLSPYFAGPARADGPRQPSRSLPALLEGAGDRRAVPSMILGVTGPRGNTEDEVLGSIRKALDARGKMPRKPVVYFMNHEDRRSLCRQWEFAAVREELESLGIRAVAPASRPGNRQSILGVMEGRFSLRAGTNWRIVPGGVADHLTSFSARFQEPTHDKLSYWIMRGAVSSSGAVSEPFAIWAKFPHARFYAHYVRGCTILESYLQSVASPLQLLLVGDPLAAPYAPRLHASWKNEEGEGAWSVEVKEKDEDVVVSYAVDGRPVDAAHGRVAVEEPGVHRLRATAVTTGTVRFAEVLERDIVVPGAPVFTVSRASTKAVSAGEPVDLVVGCHAGAEGIQVANWGRVLATLPAGTGGVVRLEARDLGRGPARVSATAVLSDGRRIRTPTLSWMPAGPAPPEVIGIRRVERPGGGVVWEGRAGALGSHAPATAGAWRILENPAMKTDKGGIVKSLGPHRYALTPVIQRADVWRWAPNPGAAAGGASLRFELNKPRRFPGVEHMGIAFNIVSHRRFDFFGLVGGWGWAFVEVRDGEWSVVASWPDSVALDRPHTLSVVTNASGGLRGWVEGEGSLAWADGTLNQRPVGVAIRGVKGGITFSNPAVRIAQAPLEDGRWIWPRQAGPDAPMLVRIRQDTRWTDQKWKPRRTK